MLQTAVGVTKAFNDIFQDVADDKSKTAVTTWLPGFFKEKWTGKKGAVEGATSEVPQARLLLWQRLE